MVRLKPDTPDNGDRHGLSGRFILDGRVGRIKFVEYARLDEPEM